MTNEAPNDSARMYFSSSLGVIFSKAVGMLAGVASLWLLTRILSVEDFASYTFAMSLVFVLGFVSGLGLERVMLLKIGSLPPVEGVLQGGALARRISFQVALSSVAIVALTWSILVLFPVLSANNNLLGWFLALMPIVPAVALTAVLIAWLQANHVVGWPQAIHGQVDGLRCLGFLGTYLTGLGAAAVAAAAVIASIVPPVRMAMLQSRRVEPAPLSFTLRDVLDGLNFFCMRLAQLGFMHADILIIGVLAPPEVVAPYVIASRFALLLEAGQQIFVPAYTPRVRRYVEDGAPEKAAREYFVARLLAFLAASSGAFALWLIGRPLLGFFGDFETAYPVLLIMCAGQLMLVGAGMHSFHLSMSGHLTVATRTQLAGLLVYLGLLLLLVPTNDSLGAALAFFLAQMILAALGLLMLWRHCQIWPFKTPHFLGYLLVPTCLMVAALVPDLVWVGGLGVLGSIGLIIWSERALLRSVGQDGLLQAVKLRKRS